MELKISIFLWGNTIQSVTLDIKEMESKTTMRYSLDPWEWPKVKRLTKPIIGKKPSYIASGNAKWYNNFKK